MAIKGKRPGLLPPDQLPLETRQVIGPAVEVLVRLTGVSLPKIRKLPLTASTEDIINKLNEIIDRIQED